MLVIYLFRQGVGNTLKRHYETYLLEYELAHDDVDGECCLLCHRFVLFSFFVLFRYVLIFMLNKFLLTQWKFMTVEQ
jgi:hypothetical protein